MCIILSVLPSDRSLEKSRLRNSYIFHQNFNLTIFDVIITHADLNFLNHNNSLRYISIGLGVVGWCDGAG